MTFWTMKREERARRRSRLPLFSLLTNTVLTELTRCCGDSRELRLGRILWSLGLGSLRLRQ